MAEPTKHVFSRNSDDESDRVPENGGTPRLRRGDPRLVGSRTQFPRRVRDGRRRIAQELAKPVAR